VQDDAITKAPGRLAAQHPAHCWPNPLSFLTLVNLGALGVIGSVLLRVETPAFSAGRKPFRVSVQGDTFSLPGDNHSRHGVAVPAVNRSRAWVPARAGVGDLALSVKRESQHVASG